MGVITISMDNNSEKMLRKMAKAKYGDKKDAISKTIIDALLQQENKVDIAAERLKKHLMETQIKSNKTGVRK
jgi:alpha-D-ribose 1-methylphosphonate 5-triphosphate synthase subunit PhnG